MKIAIDPSLFVWDKADIDANRYGFSKVASAVVEMYSLVEEYGLQLIASSGYLTEVLSAFPCGELAGDDECFGDYIRSTMSFLSRGICDDSSCLPCSVCVPPPISNPSISKSHYGASLNAELVSLLSGMVSYLPDSRLITQDSIIGGKLAIAVGSDVFNVDAILVFSFGETLLRIYGRVYEEHPKHHHSRGWATRLPKTLSDADLQTLLDGALLTSVAADSYVVFSTKAGCFLRYRRHHANIFHAYPVKENEVEQIRGVTIGAVPSL